VTSRNQDHTEGLGPSALRLPRYEGAYGASKFIPLVVRTSSGSELLRILEAVPVPTRCGVDQSRLRRTRQTRATTRYQPRTRRHRSRCVRFRCMDSDTRSELQQECARTRLAAFGAMREITSYRAGLRAAMTRTACAGSLLTPHAYHWPVLHIVIQPSLWDRVSTTMPAKTASKPHVKRMFLGVKTATSIGVTRPVQSNYPIGRVQHVCPKT
jgi:hypothetical protein